MDRPKKGKQHAAMNSDPDPCAFTCTQVDEIKKSRNAASAESLLNVYEHHVTQSCQNKLSSARCLFAGRMNWF
jgi:hypothetical protein